MGNISAEGRSQTCIHAAPHNRLIAALAYSEQLGSEKQVGQGACPTLTVLLRRTIRDHLCRSRPASKNRET